MSGGQLHWPRFASFSVSYITPSDVEPENDIEDNPEKYRDNSPMPSQDLPDHTPRVASNSTPELTVTSGSAVLL